MKKLIGTFIFIFVLYVVYYDLTQGTLSKPTSIILVESKSNTQIDRKQKEQNEKEVAKVDHSLDSELHFMEVKVTAGQTVLSVVEQIHNGPLPVSISQLVTDFQLLNPDAQPEKIQIGKVYKFPVYDKNQ